MKHSVTPSQVAVFRLRRHHLARRRGSSITAVARDVCAIHAQVTSAAALQLWARVPGITRDDIHRALWRDRTLVKTYAMRGTLHLITTDDYPFYISALKATRVQADRRILARYGVTARDVALVTESVLQALADGPMVRRELSQHVLGRVKVSKKARAWFELSWWGVVRQAVIAGQVCYGPERGPESTLILVDQWLPELPSVPAREAAAHLLRRYVQGYGPVTLRDFAKWTGMSVKEAQAAFETLEDELVEVSVRGERRWLLRSDRQQLARRPASPNVVNLLPHFDPYLLGHADKDHLIDAAHYKEVYRKAGWIYPVVLHNGRAVATWSYKRVGKKIAITVEPFGKIAKAIRGKIEAEAARLGRFFEKPTEISYGR
jgi:uncharacterized protein YcaQ